MPTASSVLADYRSLPIPDQNTIKSAIISHIGIEADMESFVEAERFKDMNVHKERGQCNDWHN